VALCG